MKHVQVNTRTGLVALRLETGELTYCSPEHAHVLCKLYGAHIVGRDTAAQAQAYVNKTSLTGRRVIVKVA